MRRFLVLFILVPLAVVAIVLSVANRGAVTVSLDPFGSASPRWAVELVKSKGGTAGRRRIVEWNHETLSFRLAAALADRAPPASDVEQAGDRAGGRKWAAAS